MAYKTFGSPGSTVSMPSAEDMGKGNITALDWINFIVGLNKRAAGIKKEERNYYSRAITGAAQGLTANMGSDELQSALNDIDTISLKHGEKSPLRDFGMAHSNRIKGRLKIARQRENTSRNLASLRGDLNDLTNLAKAGQSYDSTEAMKILDNLNDIHTAGYAYLDKQLDYDTKALQQQAGDIYSVLSYMEQLDTMDYIKEKAGETIGIQLAEGEKGTLMKYGGKKFTKETLTRAAEDAFTAGNYAEAQKLLSTMQLEEETRGMKLAEVIRTTRPDVELAENHIKSAAKAGDIDEADKVFPTFNKLYGGVNSKVLNNPRIVENAFDELSSYLLKVAKKEEWANSPTGMADLDEYLYGGGDYGTGYKDSLIDDLTGGTYGSEDMSLAVARIINAREKMDKGYYEATGKRLIGMDRGVDELVFDFTDPHLLK